jgi:hypothetical protein
MCGTNFLSAWLAMLINNQVAYWYHIEYTKTYPHEL